MKDQAQLIGERRRAGRAVALQLGLVELDEVLGLAPGAIVELVEPLGRRPGQRRHHGADVRAERGRLDAGDDAALALPGARGVSCLGMGAADWRPLLRPHHRAGVRCCGDGGVSAQRRVHGQTEEEVDAGGLAPVHQLGPGVMTIAAQQDAGVRPVAADAPDQAAHMSARLGSGRRFGRAQNESDGAFRLGFIDMDGREAALAVKAVPERKLLLAMGGVEGVVDIQRDRCGRGGVAVAIEIDHRVAQADRRAQIRRVLPAAHRRLAGEAQLRLGRPADRHLEGRVMAQRIQIVGVLVSRADRQHARPQNIGQRMRRPRRIAPIRDQPRQSVRDPQAALRLSQKHHAAIRGDATAIEGGADFLAGEGWKRGEFECRIGHGGGAIPVRCEGWLRHPILNACSVAYATVASLESLRR